MASRKKEIRVGTIVDKVVHVETHVSYPLFEDTKTKEKYIVGEDYDPKLFVSYSEFTKKGE